MSTQGSEPSNADEWVRGMVEENTLAALEFEPTCTVCDETAAWFIANECCEHSTVMCIGCHARWETLIALSIGRPVHCRGCGATGDLTWAWYRTERI